MQIYYLTEDPATAYVKGLAAAKSLDELQEHIGLYDRVASDALEAVSKMSGDDFAEFQAGLAQERRGRFAGEEFALKYGAVVMPEVMLHVSMVANHFKAPWGCAYIRMRDMGQIKEKNGIASLVKDSPKQHGDDRGD